MEDLPFMITYHPKKSSSARIRDGKIVLRISSYISKTERQKHIETLIQKITASWAKVRHSKRKDILELAKQGQLKLSTGQHYKVNFKLSDRKSVTINKIDDTIIVQIPTRWTPQKVNAMLKKKLWEFLKRDQHALLQWRMNAIRQNWIPETFHALKLKQTKSRWGSCERKTKTIMLCLKLLVMEPELLDYVIIHELAHLRFTNHSKNFWQLVAEKCPNYRDLRKTLNAHI